MNEYREQLEQGSTEKPEEKSAEKKEATEDESTITAGNSGIF